MHFGLPAAGALLALSAGTARAATNGIGVASRLFEVKFGILYHDMDYPWSGFRFGDGGH